jgi:hypothetical protein
MGGFWGLGFGIITGRAPMSDRVDEPVASDGPFPADLGDLGLDRPAPGDSALVHRGLRRDLRRLHVRPGDGLRPRARSPSLG